MFTQNLFGPKMHLRKEFDSGVGPTFLSFGHSFYFKSNAPRCVFSRGRHILPPMWHTGDGRPVCNRVKIRLRI